MKIENVLPTEGGKHFFEGAMFDLQFHCNMLKIENVLPTEGRKHIFENVMYEPNHGGHSFFSFRSSPLVPNDNYKIRLDGAPAECAGALGRDLREV